MIGTGTSVSILTFVPVAAQTKDMNLSPRGKILTSRLQGFTPKSQD
jgi:hypothetical protein